MGADQVSAYCKSMLAAGPVRALVSGRVLPITHERIGVLLRLHRECGIYLTAVDEHRDRGLRLERLWNHVSRGAPDGRMRIDRFHLEILRNLQHGRMGQDDRLRSSVERQINAVTGAEAVACGCELCNPSLLKSADDPVEVWAGDFFAVTSPPAVAVETRGRHRMLGDGVSGKVVGHDGLRE
jgi:hypothetical protein